MSKVIAVDGIPKQKLFRRNRRIETSNKKKQRKARSKYAGGYYYHDGEHLVNTYKLVEVPETTKDIYKNKFVDYPVFDENCSVVGRRLEIEKVFVKTEVIPAHKEKRVVGINWAKTKWAGVRKINTHSIKKTWRKIAAKKFRKSSVDVSNGSAYKKNFDLWWAID